jgi:VIT1/CCC1 family predicted Fe2+/Mn2+ transporter
LLAALASVGIGSGLARLTGRSALRSSLRQLIVTVVAAAVTFGAGKVLGAQVT